MSFASYGANIVIARRNHEGSLSWAEKGQVTIPIEMREQLGLHQALVERMRGRGTVRMTTDQILAADVSSCVPMSSLQSPSI